MIRSACNCKCEHAVDLCTWWGRLLIPSVGRNKSLSLKRGYGLLRYLRRRVPIYIPHRPHSTNPAPSIPTITSYSTCLIAYIRAFNDFPTRFRTNRQDSRQRRRVTMFSTLFLAALLCLIAPSASSGHVGYLAPLECMDVIEKHPNEYLVTFYKNHTLEQHFRVIGRDLLSSPKFERGPYGYQATMDDKTRDEQVRRDPGVLAVEANRPLYATEPHDIEIFELPKALGNRASFLTKREYRTDI
jgi:hypothetical protein